MSSRRSAIITTRLPPAVCGIGAYSAHLRSHAPNESAVHFIVVDDAVPAAPFLEGDTLVSFDGKPQKLAAALERLGSADVLLHYAGRAYHTRGIPLSLPRVLRAWKRKFPDSRLMVFFHELPGSMPMTTPHFWLGKLNAHIIRQLASLAEAVATNSADHAVQLHRITSRSDIAVLPVASNIEPAASASNSARALTEFALFGLPFGRLQTLRLFHEPISRWIEQRLITKLHVIGPRDDRFAIEADALIASWPDPAIAIQHGSLASPEVARLLGAARFALTNVNAESWSKSSAFMASAANGCAVVLREKPPASVPLSYVIAADEIGTISQNEVAARAAALTTWYQEHADWPVIAARLAQLWPAEPLVP